MAPAASAPSALVLSVEELYALQKMKMQGELQAELLSWAQNRLWIIATLGIVIGFFGVRALVREMLATELKDATKASADASASAALGRDAIKEVRAEANKYKDEVAAAAEALAQVRRQIDEVRSRIDAESVRVGAQIELKVDSLSRQIGELAESITRLAPVGSSDRPAEPTTRERIQKLREAAKTEGRSFEENSNYRVVVVHHDPPSRTAPIATELVERLARLGFKASAGSWVKDHKDTKKAVDIEVKPDAHVVSDVIKAAVAAVLKDLKQPPALKVREHAFADKDYEVRIFF